MRLFHVTVLVRFSGVNPLWLHSVMVHQRCIAPGELFGIPILVDRDAQGIGLMKLRYPAQFPYRPLKSLAQTLKGLREAHAAGLPVGFRQHKMIQHVRKRLPGDGDSQIAHVGEIRLCQTPGMVFLGKHHLFRMAFGSSPSFDLPLQRSQLPVGKDVRIAILQVFKYRHRL
jgi:hypothetical protein